MNLRLVTPPPLEPASLEEAKLHLRVDHAADDELIKLLVTAARQRVEAFTSRALCTQTWTLNLAGFPADAIEVPLPPLQSVTHIKYVDPAGTLQTWSADEYFVEIPSGPTAERARIYPRFDCSYPDTRAQPDAVEVQFVCGYGNPDAVPAALRVALLLRLGDLYARRESGVTGPFTETKAEQMLMWPFRSLRAA
ncbi:MAG: head-tail connector protein [Vicinamibacteria bacterium]|nr:head-tail connector protein [Vicinamibacteria bacterium]